MIRIKLKLPDRLGPFIELYTIVDDDEIALSSLEWKVGGISGQLYPYNANEKIRLHRAIMGNPKGMDVHHINGNTLDNRKCNLQVLSPEEHRRMKQIRKNKQNSITVLL